LSRSPSCISSSHSFSPICITAYRLFETMRGAHFSDAEKRQEFDELVHCDILLIDDLGTEPQTKSTSAYLFQIINERNNNDLHTIISTNCAPEQLCDIYSERVASRLMDVSKTVCIKFYGRDLRMIQR